MNGLDALATAIMWREGEPGFRPPARNFRNLNPGNLREAAGPRDAGGFAIFDDFVTGYSRLIHDLAGKFSGANSHGLGQTSTLLDLMKVYAPAEDSNNPNSYAAFVAAWISLALGKPITLASPLSAIWTPPR
jgi:hypothetical protein